MILKTLASTLVCGGIALAQDPSATQPTTQPATQPAKPDGDHVIKLPDGTVLDPTNFQGGMVFTDMAVMKTVGPNGTVTKTKDEQGRNITITDGDDGEITVLVEEEGKEAKEYKAKDIEELRAAHPEIADLYEQYSGGGMITINGMPGGASGQFRIALQGAPGMHMQHGMMHGMNQSLFGASGMLVFDDFIKSQLGGGFQVMRVKKDSRAEKLGLEANDLVKSVNGNPIETEEAFKEATAIDGKLLVDVLRAGKPVTLDEK